MRPPRLSALAVPLLAALVISGCGGGSATSGVGTGRTVVTVDGMPIKLGTFQHWVLVSIASDEAGNKVGPVVPDPPHYTKCVAQAGKALASQHPTHAQLLSDCQTLYQDDSTKALDFLIKADWLLAAGEKAGVVPSAAAVEKTFQTEEKSAVGSGTTLAQFLATTHETKADILLKIKADAIAKALTARVGSASKLQSALTAYYRPLTHCTKLYVMTDCAESLKSTGRVTTTPLPIPAPQGSG